MGLGENCVEWASGCSDRTPSALRWCAVILKMAVDLFVSASLAGAASDRRSRAPANPGDALINAGCRI